VKKWIERMRSRRTPTFFRSGIESRSGTMNMSVYSTDS
jgi:hypothetical protein